MQRAARSPHAPLQPLGAAVGADGRIWIADGSRGRIVTRIGARWRPVPCDVDLARPTAVAELPGGELAVVDTPAHRVIRLDPASGRAEILAERGEIGEGLNFPVDALGAPNGDLWVVDALNAAIQRLPAAGGPPAFVAGGPGQGGAALVRPKGLAVDAAGRLHVVDAGMQHVQVYEPDSGTLLGRYGRPGSGAGELALPSGICIEADRVYVADTLNRRIGVFALLEDRSAQGAPVASGGAP